MNAGQITNAIIALATLITAVTALIKVFRTDTKVDQVKEVATATQDLVNGKNDNLINRTVQLQNELQSNNIPIPPDPNVKANQ